MSQGWSFLSEAHLQCKRKSRLMVDMGVLWWSSHKMHCWLAECKNKQFCSFFPFALIQWHIKRNSPWSATVYTYQVFHMCSVVAHESRIEIHDDETHVDNYVPISWSHIDSVHSWPLSDATLHCFVSKLVGPMDSLLWFFVQDIGWWYAFASPISSSKLGWKQHQQHQDPEDPKVRSTSFRSARGWNGLTASTYMPIIDL